MKISLPLLLVSWFTLATSDGVEHVFPSNAETTYKWTAEVSTGVTLPGSNDNHASYFAFNANLRVRTDGTNKVFFKIENMTHSAYNGPVKDDKSKSPKEEHEFVETCKDCGTVFAAVYDKGKISNIELDESDKLYVRNKKRAIISQFQLDFQHIPSSLAFTSSEQGVTGLCHLVQSVQFHHDKDFVSLRKFFNNNNCTGKHERKENLSFNQCSQSTSNPVSHTTQRNYKLGKKVKLFVSTVKSRSSIVTQPHGLETEAYFHVTTQNVETISSNPARDDEWSIGKTISTSLLFEFPEENLETGEDIDMSFGNIVYDPEITVNKTMKILKTLGEHLKSTENLNPEQLHALDMKREIATGFLRRMNTETLKTLGEMIVQTEDRTMRNIALEVLPRIGTLASVRVIMGMKHRDLMNFRNSSELLVYSAIVGEVCEKIECPDVFDLIKSFFEKMQASADYGTKLLYLQALGNIHLDVVAKYLEPIIRDKVNYPHTLRFAAVQAAYPTQVTRPGKAQELYWPILQDKTEHNDLRHAALTVLIISNPTTESFLDLLWFINSTEDPDIYNMFYTTVKSLFETNHPCFQQLYAHELYWPILQDKTEHNDMRHAALTVLIISNPTTERFLDLLWFINTTEDPDIYNMFYTTVKSLFETNHPCFQQLSISVEEVIRLMPKRKVPSYASFTSIMDYEDPESGNGIKFQTMMISDVNTGFPNILYLDAVPHYNGIVGSAISVGFLI
ncbi:hypothetical protein B566_EDAN011935 [Ephemera danica]|nr:hypothetical protein B566_EDAN011935 [Ephemera danica]